MGPAYETRTVLPRQIAEAAERSASPAAVGAALARLVERDPTLGERLGHDGSLRTALVAVLGASRSLTALCETDPAAVEVLAALDHREACGAGSPDDLVRWKRLELLRIAARDLVGMDGLEEVGSGLARMADDVFAAAWRLTGTPSIAVVAMGKYGGRELNYASDVDVLFVGSGDVGPALELARRCFRVDADLRPEGRDGVLVRSLDSYRSYWRRWAKTWEFQALLKARAAAGDAGLGTDFAGAASEVLWSRPFGADEVRQVRQMKARAEGEMVRRGLFYRELKRGRGGIRDVEFAVQLLQLVHGHADPSLRSPTTLVALGELASAGYIARDDAGRLAEAYRFLRTVEHRLQLWDEGQVHAVPTGGESLERLARVCGFRGDAVGGLLRVLRYHQTAARSLHEQIFFRPLLEAFSGVKALSAGMSDAAIDERLAAFGFAEARRTREALAELTRGLTRRSRLMQQFLPLLLEWLSDSPDPDGGLLGLRTLAAGSHRADTLARMFRDAPDGGRRLCLVLGGSRLVGAGLAHHPDLVADFADPGLPRAVTREDLREMAGRTLAARRVDERVGALRRFREYHELAVMVRDLLDRSTGEEVARELTVLAEVVLEEALALARAATGVNGAVAVIAMGRFGGSDLSYASDLDVMLVHDGHSAEDHEAAEHLAAELRRRVNGPTPAERLWTLDLGLRPEGKHGPLTRSLAGYEQYYARWAHTWERQALLRSRFAAGDAELGARFAAVANQFLGQGVTELEEREIRRIKARIERERIPATDDPDFHLKLGRGGLSDVEWTVQLLQLRHRVWGQPGTLAALAALAGGGHVTEQDADTLAAAYRYCERARNRLYLTRGAPGDALPARADQLGKLARSLLTTGPELREEYRRVTRRCREVVERLFYDGGRAAPRPRRVPGT